MRHFLLLLLPFTAVLLHAAEPVVRILPETASLFVYEPFLVRLEIGGTGDKDPEIPEFPDAPGISFSTVRKGPVLKIGGENVRTLRLEIVPEREGLLTLPPLAIRIGDRTVESPPLRLNVMAPHQADGMDLRISLTPASVYVDQVADLTVTWSSSVFFARLKGLLFDLPLLRMDHLDIYPLEPPVPEEKRIGLPVDEERVIAQKGDLPTGGQYLTFSCKVVPRAPGTFRSADARVDCALLRELGVGAQYISCFNNAFFEQPGPDEHYGMIYFSAPVPELTAKALPVEGRTELYAGIVGAFTASAAVDAPDTVVGHPMLLTVTMQGLAFGRSVTAVPPASLDGLKPEFSVVPDPIRETASLTSRSFTFVIHPLRAGLDRIPAISFQYFDPENGKYETVRTAPIPVHITPDGDRTFYQPDALSNNHPPVPLSGIRQNLPNAPIPMSICHTLGFLARFWWIWAVVPPLCWLFLRPLAAWLDLRRTKPAYARAAARFRREFPKLGDAAWRNYLADRLGLDAAALTAESVACELRKRGVDPELTGAVCEHFGHHDAAFYARQKAPAADTPSARLLVRRLQKATRIALLLLVCLPVFAFAKSPSDLFGEALRKRAEKPDEARPLFARAALGFESEGRFLNAANSWFFAGENGRALVNYRAAGSRTPLDRQVRESIAFIRAQHTGAFTREESTPSKLTSWFWNGLCRWQPILRFGWIVLVYLLAWLLFFASRLAGFRIHRAAWIVLAVAAAIPALSLAVSLFLPREGVVVQQTIPRLGPGYAYDAAFKEPLTDATEFLWLESRDGWVHARFPDSSEAWLADPSVLPVK